MIRTVKTSEITENIKEMCIEANYYLSRDMDAAMKNAAATEESELGQKILNQLQDNLEIADKEQIQFVRIPEWQWYLLKLDRMFILKVML